jgi:hypothetical protein
MDTFFSKALHMTGFAYHFFQERLGKNVTMNAIRSMLRTSIVVGRRSYTNSMEGPVHTWSTLTTDTACPRALK